MPAGDPAGYLPNVKKNRKRRGYVPRAKRVKGFLGDQAPAKGVARKPFPMPRRTGGTKRFGNIVPPQIAGARRREIQRAYKARRR